MDYNLTFLEPYTTGAKKCNLSGNLECLKNMTILHMQRRPHVTTAQYKIRHCIFKTVYASNRRFMVNSYARQYCRKVHYMDIESVV